MEYFNWFQKLLLLSRMLRLLLCCSFFSPCVVDSREPECAHRDISDVAFYVWIAVDMQEKPQLFLKYGQSTVANERWERDEASEIESGGMRRRRQ